MPLLLLPILVLLLGLKSRPNNVEKDEEVVVVEAFANMLSKAVSLQLNRKLEHFCPP